MAPRRKSTRVTNENHLGKHHPQIVFHRGHRTQSGGSWWSTLGSLAKSYGPLALGVAGAAGGLAGGITTAIKNQREIDAINQLADK